MDIITTARRFEMTPEIREHARKRLGKLERYLDRFAEAHVVLTREKYRHIAEISLHAKGMEISSREQSDDMMTSIDRVVERVERQAKRMIARRKQRKTRRTAQPLPASPEAPGETGEDEEPEAEIEDAFAPVVIREESFHPEPLSVEEAIERLKDRDEDYFLFTNRRGGAVTVKGT